MVPVTLINNAARTFGFALLTTLLIPLVGASVTVRSSEDGTPINGC